MILQEIFKSAFLAGRFQVVHRVPGRLRLTVPDLALVPDEFGEHIEAARMLLETLPGLRDVSVNRLTRSIVLRYDPSVVPESRLIGWLEHLVEAGLKRYGELNSEMNIQQKITALRNHMAVVVERMRMRHAATAKN